ncbi:NusG domain II-containing protein [Geotoga petraea]|jgi:hypothetical protein|uniref:Uncharacterized protein n=1 Tax=Geotoga petraea TaxID=28234 RepID=A0A1G6L1V2_9BACT|nr:NusG domain II-containing protein [Geotoga petraea]TGG88809.1 hypothetical protein E4650_01030 [Geotoga petraea]SDC37163.1 hypothetical protein SAMN04488588_0975 [Geotoga petraea]
MPNFVKKRDIYILIVIFAIAGIFMLFNSFSKEGITGAEVYLKGEKIMTITEEGTYSVYDENGVYHLKVVFMNGTVKVVDTDEKNPLKIVEHMGPTNKSNQQLIAMPNSIVVKPIGGKESEVDVIVQ